jgi:O-antigen ligase
MMPISQNPVPSVVGPIARRFWIVLFLMLIMAQFLPVFSAYGTSLLVLVWILASGLWRRCGLTTVDVNFGFQRIISPVHAGVLFYAAMMLIAAVLAAWSSPWSGGWGRSVDELRHLLLKSGLVWFVLASAFTLSWFTGWRPRKIVVLWLVVALINLAYMFLQRWTGVDWAKGLDATLGPHRFAYGVYRVSGFMGHPLSLSYNLVMMVVTSIGFLMMQNGWIARVPSWQRAALAGVLMLSLVITGSRWPLFAAMLAIFLSWGSSLWRWRVQLAVVAACLLGILWIEGSILSRVLEIFASQQSLAQRFDRIVFWQAHWQMFLDHPLAGIGLAAGEEAKVHYYNLVGGSDKLYQAHNIFLQTLADSGLVGLTGLVGFLVGLSLAAKRALKDFGSPVVLAILVATVLSGLFQNNLRDSEFMFALWMAILIAAMSSVPEDSTDNARNRAGSHTGLNERKSIENFKPGAGATDPEQDVSG